MLIERKEQIESVIVMFDRDEKVKNSLDSLKLFDSASVIVDELDERNGV